MTVKPAFFGERIIMEKLDLVKKYKAYYTAKTVPAVIDIEKAQFLSVTGQGDPSSVLFAEKIQALYSVAYTLKFACKSQGKDFAVPKLEGLWWFDTGKYGLPSLEEAPRQIPRSEWNWRLLIRMPDYVSEGDVAGACDAVKNKKALPYADEPELFILHEGKVVQVLHVGPFDEEPRTLAKLRDFMEAHKLAHAGLHHEIYLSDFRKTPPAKLKTILREPVS
jgi:hypothetical protein